MMEAGRWVEFTDRFNFIPKAKPNAGTLYPKGYKGRVTKECADRAIEAGKAKESTDPRATSTGGAAHGGGTAQHTDKGSTAGVVDLK